MQDGMEYEDSEQGQCLRERPEKKAKETSHGADTDRIRGGECETQEGREGTRNLGAGREYEHSERKENRGKDPGKESTRPATEQKDEMKVQNRHRKGESGRTTSRGLRLNEPST